MILAHKYDVPLSPNVEVDQILRRICFLLFFTNKLVIKHDIGKVDSQ